MAGLAAYWQKTFGRAKADPDSVRRVKDWARAALGGEEDVAFAVNEIACNDPGCPGIETVILVMEPGRKTRACKVQKPLDEVTEPDVRAALAL
jgi:hypothetical protein